MKRTLSGLRLLSGLWVSVITGALPMLYAAEDIPISIANLSDGQEVSGYVRVELESADLTGYRRISYCVDGKLVYNAYEPPFTAEIDSRDFPNGTHELSVRALRKNAPVHRSSVRIEVHNTPQSFNFLIGAPERLVARDHIPYHQHYIDAPHVTLKKNESELYFFHNKGLMMHERENQGVTSCFSGTLESPLQTIEWAGYVPEVWDKNGHATQGIWLMSMHKTGENELLGFTHNESCFDKDMPCNREQKSFSIGLGYSEDNGRSWTYCGDILRTPVYGENTGSNIKGVPYLLKDGYFYIYFWEFPDADTHYPAVARAAVDEVTRAARKGKNVPWKKYRNGSWTEDGLTGVAGDVMEETGKIFNMHCQVSYLPSIRKYLMITYENGKPHIYLLLSEDGLEWQVAEKLIDHNSEGRVSYPFFGDFLTEDGHEMDHDFYIYWAKDHRELWGARVRLKAH